MTPVPVRENETALCAGVYGLACCIDALFMLGVCCSVLAVHHGERGGITAEGHGMLGTSDFRELNTTARGVFGQGRTDKLVPKSGASRGEISIDTRGIDFVTPGPRGHPKMDLILTSEHPSRRNLWRFAYIPDAPGLSLSIWFRVCPLSELVSRTGGIVVDVTVYPSPIRRVSARLPACTSCKMA